MLIIVSLIFRYLEARLHLGLRSHPATFRATVVHSSLCFVAFHLNRAFRQGVLTVEGTSSRELYNSFPRRRDSALQHFRIMRTGLAGVLFATGVLTCYRLGLAVFSAYKALSSVAFRSGRTHRDGQNGPLAVNATLPAHSQPDQLAVGIASVAPC
jgi:hypothetical protein